MRCDVVRRNADSYRLSPHQEYQSGDKAGTYGAKDDGSPRQIQWRVALFIGRAQYAEL